MRLVVVGAGITGLAAAFEWRRRRPDDEIVVLEAGDRIGGKLHRVELAGHWYDTGPEAMLARVPEAVALVEALGRGDRLVAPATTQASVVLPDGRHPLPAGTVLGVPASADGLDGLLSPDGVDRVRAEAGLPPLTLDGDVAVGALLRERLGDEIVDRLVEPLLGGVYAGRADELSLTATMPALAAELPAAGSVLAAAAAARDAGVRSRGDDDGPVFATVTDWGALVVPMACAPNVSEVGVNVTAGADVGEGDGLPPPPDPESAPARAARRPSVTTVTALTDNNRETRIVRSSPAPADSYRPGRFLSWGPSRLIRMRPATGSTAGHEHSRCPRPAISSSGADCQGAVLLVRGTEGGQPSESSGTPRLLRPSMGKRAPGPYSTVGPRWAVDVLIRISRDTRSASMAFARSTPTSRRFWTVRLVTRSYSRTCAMILRSISSAVRRR